MATGWRKERSRHRGGKGGKAIVYRRRPGRIMATAKPNHSLCCPW